MQKVQIPWSQVSTRLTEALRDSDLSMPALAARTGVDYHAIRRMILNGVKNRSENALTLCRFFNIPLETAKRVSADTITAAVLANWDGTPEHGQLLMDLTRCAGEYAVRSHCQTEREAAPNERKRG